jgi:hypothetical protein
MNGKRIQVNGRSAISLLLAVLIMVIATTPALAKEDEGGGFQSDQVVLLDDEMGVVCLKVMYPTAVSAEAPALVSVGDESMGYFSLKGASHISTLAYAGTDDEGMGYLSLRGVSQIGRPAAQALAQPALVLADDDEMGYLSLKVARQILAASGPQAIARVQ